ncbi:MAG: ArsR/SmtB family transcription factor [Flavobacterium sp.]|jgi:rhodanese-related sulfurtransferase|uniref:ArsR/SmtB family transcription factor n=1 Tax=Flavobacterium sp. J372 TaxID=2898436 RepID=UPI00215156C9|nr:metalloregulator ArsR/SmtB family transcription factor [Flavobacterium sp. J372]MCR5862582.1 metalloregulator ArsR/SmtB family transcription factor [Flavobacterium sp. J372]MDC7217470.1 metalloregulator ArsR/SmtB family transcription factor [Spirochaetales bacterium]
MNKREFKDAVYQELAKISKALANPHRLEIVDLLAQGPFSVEVIADYTGMSVANASQHLQVLKKAQLVETSKDGNFIFYHLRNEKVFAAWRSLRELGMENNTEIEGLVKDFRSNFHNLAPISAEDLLEKIGKNQVLVLDVRPEAEFNRGHIHSALSMPYDKIIKRIRELSKESEIIAYCRGPFCIYADQAVKILTEYGYKANRLSEGFPDWMSKGYPVEKAV